MIGIARGKGGFRWGALAAALAGGALLLGCSETRPSRELVDARREYDQARQGAAGALAPDVLASAQHALNAAEAANAKDPRSIEERSYAYIAKRRTEQANAQAGIVEAQRQLAVAQQTETELRRRAAGELGRTKEELAQTKQQLSTVERNVQQERVARAEAEQRANDAMRSLEAIAQVRREARGVVITLSGQVIFPSGRSELMPIAQATLDRVAEALKLQDPKAHIRIEGYTDSTGSPTLNDRLSQARAESVRQYLVTRGLDASRLDAVGRGESNPVARNDTPEGRANNRRVEIVVEGVTTEAPVR